MYLSMYYQLFKRKQLLLLTHQTIHDVSNSNFIIDYWMMSIRIRYTRSHFLIIGVTVCGTCLCNKKSSLRERSLKCPFWVLFLGHAKPSHKLTKYVSPNDCIDVRDRTIRLHLSRSLISGIRVLHLHTVFIIPDNVWIQLYHDPLIASALMRRICALGTSFIKMIRKSCPEKEKTSSTTRDHCSCRSRTLELPRRA